VKANLQRLSERIIMGTHLNATAAFPSTSDLYLLAPKDSARIPNLLNRLGEGNDSVHISKEGNDDYKVTINGHSENVSAEELQAMEFNLKSGDDTLEVDEDVDVVITANGGKGNDKLIGGKGNDKLDGGEDMDYVDGREGNDNLSGITEDGEIMIGGKGKDVFNMRAGMATWVDLDNKQDSMVVPGPTSSGNSSAPAATTPTPSAVSTTPAPVTPAATTPTATTAPAATAPATTAPAAATAAPASGVTVNGDNNTTTVIHNSAPASTASTTNAAATTTANGIAKNANFDIAASVAKGNSGLTETSTGVYTGSLGGFNVTVTQPGGAGTPISMKMTASDGALKGATIAITLNPDKSSTINVSGGSLTAEQSKSINDLVNKMQLDGLDNAFASVKKKKGGGSASTGAGAAAGGAADASAGSGSVDGSGSVSGGSGLDGTSGLDTTGSDGSDSWFMVLAVAMGTIMNKMAEKMIGLLNDIKAAGDNPPYALTSEFQATAQMLSFMQQAFMAALNALGESIKTSVTAGGAAR
jgi:RTX calcium-binding nonapeptide repeat (4 copies)